MKLTLTILVFLFFAACNSGADVNSADLSPSANASNRNSQTATPKPEEDRNARFRVPTKGFESIDFKNLSYPYKFNYNGRRINFKPTDDQFDYEFENNDNGWFDFSEVFFVDVTGDKKPEAIVRFWHVSCGVSCDGGAGLFYFFEASEGKPRLIWQFETGSLKYGCGLKSFSVKSGIVIVEQFDKCGDRNDNPAEDEPTDTSMDVTRTEYKFNGRRFVRQKREFLKSPPISTLNYRAEYTIETENQ